MPEPVTVAVTNDACLHEGTVACYRDRPHVVVAQVEVALHITCPSQLAVETNLQISKALQHMRQVQSRKGMYL